MATGFYFFEYFRFPKFTRDTLNYKTGVQPEEQATREAVDKFNEAFNRHDVDRLAALLIWRLLRDGGGENSLARR